MTTVVMLREVLDEARDFAQRAPDLDDRELKHAKNRIAECHRRLTEPNRDRRNGINARRMAGIAEAKRHYFEAVTKTMNHRIQTHRSR